MWAGSRGIRVLALPMAAAVLVALAGTAARADDDEDCLSCHGDPALTLDLPSGEKAPLHVDASVFKRSVHGGNGCLSCHADKTEVPHVGDPPRTLAEHRARSRLSQPCAACHDEIASTYARSVHGRALMEKGNPDVPACTDCHRAHDIQDPRNRAWRLETPKLCARCHADEKLARRYGLSPRVVQTYLADFHGMTASLHARGKDKNGRFTAVCVDCHGVHDIARADDPGSRVVKANLVKTCRGCHAGATENFPEAWLSHYEPSMGRFPLVYGVRAFYVAFVPLVIGGLVLQIGLHLRAYWRSR